jgi:hypothetical protein
LKKKPRLCKSLIARLSFWLRGHLLRFPVGLQISVAPDKLHSTANENEAQNDKTRMPVASLCFLFMKGSMTTSIKIF